MIPLMMCHSEMDVVATRDLSLTVTSSSSRPTGDAALSLSHTASAAALSLSSLSSQQPVTVTTCAVPSSHIGVIQNQHIANTGMCIVMEDFMWDHFFFLLAMH